MSLKHLQDLPRLQIPDVHLRVFTATHDRLPSGHAETGEQTVRCIRVPRVCFDAFRGLGIPKSDSRVLCDGEDKFGVGGKLYVGTTWTPLVRSL